MPLATGGWCHKVVEGLAQNAINTEVSPADVIGVCVAGYREETHARGLDLGLQLDGFVPEEKFIERTIEEQAALLVRGRLGLGSDAPELLELGERVIPLGGESDLRLAHALRLAQHLLRFLELGRESVAFLGNLLQFHRAALLHLDEGSLQALDLGTQLVTLLGGGADYCESLENGAELQLEVLGLGGELVPFDGVPLLLVGEPALLLGGCDLRLGECRLEASELGRGLLLLLLELGQLLLVGRVGLGESAPEALDLLT